MGRMISAIEVEREFGVPAYVVRSVVKEWPIESQIIDGLISIDIQDAEKIIFEYHAKQDSYTWTEVVARFNTSPRNKSFKKISDSVLPHYDLTSGTYYPVSDVEDVIANMDYYHIKKYKNKYFYMEDSKEDFYITNYFNISDFRYELEQKYNIRLKLSSFTKIQSQIKKIYPMETVNLFGTFEYVIPWKYMEQLIEDYKNFYIVHGEKNPYERYMKKVAIQNDKQVNFKKTQELFDDFAQLRLSETKNQIEKAGTLASLREYLLNTLEKEIYLYKNDEICDFAKSMRIGRRENIELSLFLRYVLSEYKKNCVFALALATKKVAKVKTEKDFYTGEEWKGYVDFIFDIDRHIEKAFSCYNYARYWLYCMLQCSLAWRKEDILEVPALQMKDIGQYSMEWFEQNEFTSPMAWDTINTAKKFIEQDRVNKTGAKKHFIILNSFVVATAIGFIICEKHRQDTESLSLFGKFTFNYGVMTRQLGPEIKGFSNLKATRTVLSFANEMASHIDYSSQAISISSYMRSHIVDKSGFSDMTTTYLKSSFDEKELLSLPAKMGELGLFGWLYKEILIAINEEPKQGSIEELIGDIREDITPVRLEGYSKYLLQEQKKRAEILAEVMEYETDDLKELYTWLENGSSQAKKENIYCVKTPCIYPTSQNCELCEYSVPSIHALYVIGQETSELLNKMINRQGTYTDMERYSYQLFKLLTILKEARKEFGENYVSSFVDYKIISEKLNELQSAKKGVVK